MPVRVPVAILIAALATCALSGCSSSEGHMDYASIPAPKSPGIPPFEPLEEESAKPDVVVTPAEDIITSTSEDAAPADPTTNTTAPAPAESQNVADQTTGDEVSETPETTTPATDSVNPTEPDSADPEQPREIQLLVPNKHFRPEGDAGSVRVSYDDIDLLKVLNMQPVPVDAVDHFPEWLLALDGKRIRLRGFMFPTFVATGVTEFGLARDNGICCFVKEPKIYDVITVSMAQGKTTDYIENRPFDVEGTFHILPEVVDDRLLQLYVIDDAVVLP